MNGEQTTQFFEGGWEGVGRGLTVGSDHRLVQLLAGRSLLLAAAAAALHIKRRCCEDGEKKEDSQAAGEKPSNWISSRRVQDAFLFLFPPPPRICSGGGGGRRGRGRRISKQIGRAKLALRRHSGAKQTNKGSLAHFLHLRGSNEAVTAAPNRDFLLFTTAVLSA